MKKFLLLGAIFLVCVKGSTQETVVISSLDDLFAGVPLQSSFEKWVAYLSNHPFLGYDSANSRGVYSSMKPGIKSHFPFPDSILVKLLAEKDSSRVPGTLYLFYSMKIEGVFGKGKLAKEAARTCFKELKQLIRPYYKRGEGNYDITFRKGRSEKFPDCVLSWDYFDEQGLYYVLLEF